MGLSNLLPIVDLPNYITTRIPLYVKVYFKVYYLISAWNILDQFLSF